MIGYIIGIAIFIISTEIIYFKYIRGSSWNDSFIEEKLFSMFIGLFSMFIGLFVTFTIWGVPFMMAEVPNTIDAEPLGNIVYLWYYSIVGVIALFFGINYLTDKHLKNKKKKEKGE